MKKLLCIACSLLLLFSVTGCGQGAPAGTTQNLKMIAGYVEATEPLIARTQELIDWQITSSTEEMEAADKAREDGEVYEPADTMEEVRQMDAELRSFQEQVQAMSAEIDALPSDTGAEALDKTYAAAKTYFSELDAAYGDLLAISDFYFAVYEATTPIREFDPAGYSDMTLMEITWNSVQKVSADMKEVDCPQFMEQTYQKYITQVEHYSALAQSAYFAVGLQDPLRYAATGNMSVRADYQLYTCGNELTKDFNLQFGQVEERMSGRLGTLGSELITNCNTLQKAV